MSAVRAAWERWLFRDGSPYDLAAARVVFCVHALWLLLSRSLPDISDLPRVYWQFVPASTRWRYLLFPGHGQTEWAIQLIAMSALVCGMLGVRTRVSLLVSGLLLYHLAPLETIIWSDNAMERGFEVTILALVILSFAPCAEVWAVGRRRSSMREGWPYHWPLLLLQILVVEIYFLAGYHKLHHAGLAWMSADNMRRWLLALSLWQPISVHTALARYLVEHPALCAAMGVGTVVFELTAPVILFVRRIRPAWLLLALALHIGIIFSLNIVFLNTPQLLIFVNWGQLGALQRWRAGYRVRAVDTIALPT